MSWKTAALSVVPGLCHIHHGRAVRGLAWFAAFALALNLFLIAPFVTSSRAARLGALVAAATLWILAAWDGARTPGHEDAKGHQDASGPGSSPRAPCGFFFVTLGVLVSSWC